MISRLQTFDQVAFDNTTIGSHSSKRKPPRPELDRDEAARVVERYYRGHLEHDASRSSLHESLKVCDVTVHDIHSKRALPNPYVQLSLERKCGTVTCAQRHERVCVQPPMHPSHACRSESSHANHTCANGLVRPCCAFARIVSRSAQCDAHSRQAQRSTTKLGGRQI